MIVTCWTSYFQMRRYARSSSRETRISEGSIGWGGVIHNLHFIMWLRGILSASQMQVLRLAETHMLSCAETT